MWSAIYQVQNDVLLTLHAIIVKFSMQNLLICIKVYCTQDTPKIGASLKTNLKKNSMHLSDETTLICNHLHAFECI